ncbi:MAG: GNAT family N-acetyltransferase, partial [Phaeodactylibacter sp.]|nr:GNAT family N-acetyltransferase [Phaeodactylibacter sp.]
MNIRRLAADEPFPLDLLLEADPDAEKVRSYCESGQIWVMETQATLGVCVLKIKDGSLSTAEIMNIAIDPECKGKGLGKQLLSFIINEAQRQGFKRLIVATGNSSIGQLS